jgi:hypothetical protein
VSAWQDLVGFDGSDEWLLKCNAALIEIQNALRGRLARQLAAENPDRSFDFAIGVDWAIDLIDPEGEYR